MNRTVLFLGMLGAWLGIGSLAAQEVDPTWCANHEPGLAIEDNAVLIDEIDVTDDLAIGDLQISTDIRHTWISDLVITVTSPAETSVVLFDSSGSDANDLLVTWSDAGVAHGVLDPFLDPVPAHAFVCDCTMQPDGSGTQSLADFDLESSLGLWSLSVEDQATGEDGTLNGWCVIVEEGASCGLTPPEQVTCELANNDDDVQLEWTNGDLYSSLTVLRNDVSIATLEGDETSYLDENVPSGTHQYTLVGFDEDEDCGVGSLACRVEKGVLEWCNVPDAAIPDLGSRLDSVRVDDGIEIAGIRARIDVTHVFAGDLSIVLSSPSRTAVTLQEAATVPGEDLNVVYSDAGIPNGPPLDCACEMQPAGPGVMADYMESDLTGVWILDVSDNFTPDGGTLNEWCVQTLIELPQRPFRRGDADGDGAVVPLLDAIFLLDFGFNQGSKPQCEDAADVNGNNRLDVLLDTFALLAWQFGTGDAPPSPGPFLCGMDDDVESDVDCNFAPESCDP